MRGATSHDDFMQARLADPEFAAAYLQAALDDGDPGALFVAVRRVVETQGGVARLAIETGLTREALYRTLSRAGNPRFSSLAAILDAIGLRLTVSPVDDKASAQSERRPIRGHHWVAIEPRQGGRWAVQTDGAQRADSIHTTKSGAVRRGRELAQNKGVKFVPPSGRSRSDAAEPLGRDQLHARGPRRTAR
jgi:probable addiction module antidote protein